MKAIAKSSFPYISLKESKKLLKIIKSKVKMKKANSHFLTLKRANLTTKIWQRARNY